MKLPAGILSLFLLVSTLTANITVSFSVGLIFDQFGDQAELGRIGVLVADTNGNGFIGDIMSEGWQVSGTTLSVGQFIGGTSDDQIIALFYTNDNLGIGTVFDSVLDISYAGDHDPDDDWALYSFPEVSTEGNIVTSGYYGFYRSDGVDVAAGSDFAFIAPVDGYFGTLSTGTVEIGGSLSEEELAAMIVISEPSTYAAIFGAIAVLVGLLRRR